MKSGWRPSYVYLAAALGLVAAGLVPLLLAWPEPPPVAAASGPMPAPAAVANAPAAAVPAGTKAAEKAAVGAVTQVVAHAATSPSSDLADHVAPGTVPTMAEVIERLHRAGIHGGLGAFSPPGTRPPLIGLAVPQDFVLPEGYVRHHQATDDGRRIEPILMFSPDRPVFAADGTPIVIPADRVVPPALAPPGLPIRFITLPAPQR